MTVSVTSQAPSSKASVQVIDTWLVDLDDQKWLSGSGVLAREEAVRAARMATQELTARAIAGRVALREVIAQYTACPPESLVISPSGCVRCGKPHGRPVVVAPTTPHLEFSISHSSGLQAIAVSLRSPVGIDVERVHADLSLEGLARRFFSEREADFLESVELTYRPRAFFRMWTRKEACLKGVGLGLAGGLDSVEVPSWRRRHTHRWADHDVEWTVVDLDLEDGYVGALAAPGSWSVAWRRLVPSATTPHRIGA